MASAPLIPHMGRLTATAGDGCGIPWIRNACLNVPCERTLDAEAKEFRDDRSR